MSATPARRMTDDPVSSGLPDRRSETPPNKGMKPIADDMSKPQPTASSAVAPVNGFNYEMQFDYFDRFLHGTTARLTLGLSPHAVGAAWFDWLHHLARSPGRQMDLVAAAAAIQMRLSGLAMAQLKDAPVELPFQPKSGDHRFDAPEWCQFPSCYLAQSYLALEEWWSLATSHIPGVAPKHTERVAFMTRQLLDMVSPTNSAMTNPVIAEHMLSSGGRDIWQGAANLVEDLGRQAAGEAPLSQRAFEVGRDLAITPGTVVYRNHLFELIQYRAATADVHAEPILIVPAWIMKYYILDLRPENSLVRYLVGRGHTVFMISWLNPGPSERDIGLDDYRHAVMAALDAIESALPRTKIHLAGYCLGGTMAAIAAATMARDEDRRLQSLTLIAAQTDFSEAGELMLFVDESQVTFLEDMMWTQGVLKGRQMSGAFQMLRSNELVWSRLIQDYVLGERGKVFDIQAWSEDLTRMPYRMHSQYLRGLFLENRLTSGRFAVEGKVIALKDIEAPMFVVGTESDHIAPWRSVYKAHLFTDIEMTFVLTNGGHNGGVVSPPGHGKRHYRLGVRKPPDQYVDPDAWFARTAVQDGTWWGAWADWLGSQSSGNFVPARDDRVAAGQLVPLGPAPGTFVLQR